jgi:hypothetical protein
MSNRVENGLCGGKPHPLIDEPPSSRQDSCAFHRQGIIDSGERRAEMCPGHRRIFEMGLMSETNLNESLSRLGRAMAALEGAVSSRIEREGDYLEAEAEVQRMNADRARLAGELDKSEARAERLEEANKEVSRRLVTAMETIRAVLDR